MSEEIRASDYCCRVDGSAYHIEANQVVCYKGTPLWTLTNRDNAQSLFRHLVGKERSTEFSLGVLRDTIKAKDEQLKALEAALQSGSEQADQHKQEQHQQTKAELAVWRDAAIGLAELADRAFYYSREERADADTIIKAIRTLTKLTNQTK